MLIYNDNSIIVVKKIKIHYSSSTRISFNSSYGRATALKPIFINSTEVPESNRRKTLFAIEGVTAPNSLRTLQQ